MEMTNNTVQARLNTFWYQENLFYTKGPQIDLNVTGHDKK